MNNMIKLLAKLQPKDLLVAHLEQAIVKYKELPIDENYSRVAMCSTLVAIKEAVDNEKLQKFLEDMAANTIPFFIASAN
ncbi:MAG TPA: hypothetical protein VIM07_07040 [Chitinophagaceae bacterium]